MCFKLINYHRNMLKLLFAAEVIASEAILILASVQ